MTRPHLSPISPSAEASADLGRELRTLREKKGLSINDVADRLKLPVRQIEALENGWYENLPEPVFIRGFLRSYGRFLDMDEAELSRNLDLIAPADMRYRAFGHSGLNYANTKIKKGFPKWIFILLVLAGIGAAVYFWQEKSNSENAKQESMSIIPTEPADTVPPNLNASNVAVVPMADASAAASGVAVVPQAAVSGSSAAAAGGELVIATRYRTMLTVTNSKGKVLINRIVPANSEHRFKEGAPFEVRMGYATDATATFNGAAIDLSKKRTEGKSVAFTTADAGAEKMQPSAVLPTAASAVSQPAGK